MAYARTLFVSLLLMAGCRTQPLVLPGDGGAITDGAQATGDLSKSSHDLAGGAQCSSFTNAADCTAHGCLVAGCPDCQGGTTFEACYANGQPPPPFGCPAGCPFQVDLAVNQCAQETNAIQSYLDSNDDCQTNNDCTLATTGCGLPGQCGAYLASSATAGLNTVVNQAKADNCTGPCPPCVAPSPAVCTNHRCVAGMR